MAAGAEGEAGDGQGKESDCRSLRAERITPR